MSEFKVGDEVEVVFKATIIKGDNFTESLNELKVIITDEDIIAMFDGFKRMSFKPKFIRKINNE